MAVIVAAFAVGGAIVLLLSSLGLFAMRDAVDRLHYLGPAATIAPLLVASAIVVEDGLTSQSGLKALCVATLAIVTSPIVQYVTLRAIVIRRTGAPVPPCVPERQA